MEQALRPISWTVFDERASTSVPLPGELTPEIHRRWSQELKSVLTFLTMGGRNPYFDEFATVATPTRAFTVTFLPMNVTVEVDPNKIPYGDTGVPGSILDIALAHGIEVDHACGGVCACATCHAIVRKGGETLSEMSEEEEDQLSYAPGLVPESRLSCQAVADGSTNLVVYIPDWNRNLVREAH